MRPGNGVSEKLSKGNKKAKGVLDESLKLLEFNAFNAVHFCVRWAAERTSSINYRFIQLMACIITISQKTKSPDTGMYQGFAITYGDFLLGYFVNAPAPPSTK